MNEEPKTHIHRVYDFLLTQPAGYEFRVMDLLAAVEGLSSNTASAAAITLEDRGAVVCKGREGYSPRAHGEKGGRRNVYVWNNEMRDLVFLRPCAHAITRNRKAGWSGDRERKRIEAFPLLSDAMLDLAGRMEHSTRAAQIKLGRKKRANVFTRAEEVLILAERAEALEKRITELETNLVEVDQRAASTLKERIHGTLHDHLDLLRSKTFDNNLIGMEDR